MADRKPIYTPRVTRGEDGAYRWVYEIDKEHNLLGARITMRVMGVMAVMLVLLGAFMGRDALVVMLLCAVAAVVIALAVCLVFYKLAPTSRQPYELTEKYIRWVGTGRTNAYYYFRGIRRVRVSRPENMIEVRGLIGFIQVFVPPEDFSFVCEYILRRLPERADVTYDE